MVILSEKHRKILYRFGKSSKNSWIIALVLGILIPYVPGGLSAPNS